MAENIVAKSTDARLDVLESTIARIAGTLKSLLGRQSADKTTARVTVRDNAPAMARKGKSDIEDVSIVLTQAMLDGRMKLPSRMFTKGTKVVVDGHTITQQPNDQNRSTKFDPEIFGYDLAVGDTITFTHTGGRDWEVSEVEDGGGKAPRKAAKPAAKASKPAEKKPTATASKGGPKSSSGKKVSRDAGQNASLGKQFQAFADMCIENSEDEDFEENANIAATTKFDPDARLLLTTEQHRKFRAMWKRQGLTLSKAVGKLNALVYE